MDNTLPRHQIPPLFFPHRTEFLCKHELTVTPPVDPQAEIWYQQAVALDTPTLWKEDRDWPQILALYTKAAERKHWRAMNNLATLYQTGVWGLIDSDKLLVARQPQVAMALTEQAMQMGVPLAYAVMGNYYADGFIVKPDPTNAWAFWQQAAEMGSSYAQFTIGRSLNSGSDAPERGRWANVPMALKMLECAFSQGNGDAAQALGIEYDLFIKDKPRALHYLHEGVKFGSWGATNYLRSEFESVGDLNPYGIDTSRADRYLVFSDALGRNRDLRFPNLDKVLPLPPADLPQWNGNKEDLINAAKQVVPIPPPPAPTPGADLTGRAHIPQGWVLPEYPKVPYALLREGHNHVSSEYEGVRVPFSGYWLPQLLARTSYEDMLFDRQQAPQRYTDNEGFDNLRHFLGPKSGRIMWHFRGDPEQLPVPARIGQLSSGEWREARANPVRTECDGAETCPHTGIWQPLLPDEHPLKALVNWRWRQTWAVKGQPFPDPQQDWLVDVANYAVKWRLIEMG
ncbi:DUF6396 domain-containing protein [Glaciimonas sp. CA11.2]|uniref:SEL1-like repeat protein n=1 Tax=Glaciimonas sp. CA11.2 TaxID=3048601 RepID=UPI002AB40DBB|nr:DUF6396 domain-containing protein [Glaciimonas sp. CA11.2]MDY7544813.1 DUF6396 domain-containing protein [Glaciimonas sp. CA11.2]